MGPFCTQVLSNCSVDIAIQFHIMYHCWYLVADLILFYVQSSAVITRLIYRNITYHSMVTVTDTPYLTLTGELWGVYCGDFGENWLHYNSTALYLLYWQLII